MVDSDMEDRASERESLVRPHQGELKRGRERVSLFFYVCIGISSLSSFMCGFSLGFSSPTLVAFYKVGFGVGPLLAVKRNEPGAHSNPLVHAPDRLGPLPFLQTARGDSSVCIAQGTGGASDAAACVFRNGTLNEANSHMLNCELRLSDHMTSWFGRYVYVLSARAPDSHGPSRFIRPVLPCSVRVLQHHTASSHSARCLARCWAARSATHWAKRPACLW